MIEALNAPTPLWVAVVMAVGWLISVWRIKRSTQDFAYRVGDALDHEKEEREKRDRDLEGRIGRLQRFIHMDDDSEGRSSSKDRARQILRGDRKTWTQQLEEKE